MLLIVFISGDSTMARKLKQVVIEGGLDRRDTGYYSTPPEVADYIYSRLRNLNANGKSVIDPCVGKEELLKPFIENDIPAAGIDIIEHKTEYTCSFLCRDFMKIYDDFKRDDIFNHNNYELSSYDYWIANPLITAMKLTILSQTKLN